ncbi:hypothetical protein [Methylobacterium bullatum]|uniref:Uncharacterized protein n=1 Tax=Methylobacterium bullatum TaxID=570505 RepID=A0AAV4Z9T2_9HYPH|nr:hypothetical protein [Methylobacterium bullatum]GJD40864.1 hypothetical protein OICFNHDK_3340 [Methylobacterium bullatum]
MIYETFMSPHERPNSSLEIKRALLTFDKVHISDPGDRDLFPPQAFAMALGMPPLMGFNSGPVRPLGKYNNYDNEFDQLMDELDIARRENILDVTSTYDLETSQKSTIGAVLLGSYPLNVQFMLWAYRNLAQENSVLVAAIDGDKDLLGIPADEVRQASITDCSADCGINEIPATPLIEGDFTNEERRIELSNIARARLASVIKTIGFCTSKNIVPFFAHRSYNIVASQISSRANEVIDLVSEDDPFWARRLELLRIAHEEYIDESVLEKMSIDDVLKLRTRTWGKQAQARDEMLKSIADISIEYRSKSDFDDIARGLIYNYRKEAENLERDRRTLNMKIKCDIVAAGASIGAWAATTGLVTQLQTAYSAATTLAAGCLFTASKIKEYAPVREQLKSAESEFSDKIAFGLHNFYQRIDLASRG